MMFRFVDKYCVSTLFTVDDFSTGLPPLDLNGFTILSVVKSKFTSSEEDVDDLVVVVVVVGAVVVVVLVVVVVVLAVVVVGSMVVDVVVEVVVVVDVVVSLLVVDSEMKIGLKGRGLLLNLLLLLPPSLMALSTLK